MRTRGQAYTLEAITASLLLVGGLVFALQITGVTPLSASTSSQHIENQQQSAVEGALASAVEDDALRIAVLNWDGTNDKFFGATEPFYINQAPSNQFGQLLRRTFEGRGIVFNVYVSYHRTDDKIARQRMVFRGEPSDNAVAASATVVLYDNDAQYDDSQRQIKVIDESHTFDTNVDVYLLDHAPTIRNTVHQVVDDGGTLYQRGQDYSVIDANGDGKLDSLDWSGASDTPSNGETYTVDYTPAVDGNRFYAPDSANTGVYNVVTVEVVVWRQ